MPRATTSSRTCRSACRSGRRRSARRFELTIGGEAVTVERLGRVPLQQPGGGGEAIGAERVAGVQRDGRLRTSRSFPVEAQRPPSAEDRHRHRRQQSERSGDRERGAAGARGLAGRAGDARRSRSRARTKRSTVKFTLSPPATVAAGEARASKAVVTGNGVDVGSRLPGRRIPAHPSAPRRPARGDARIKVLDVTIAPGLQVGYVMGVGDKVPEAIEQLGAAVTLIDAETLASGDLSRFDAIVLGVRAYERRQDLRANNQRLLQYADNGGTVIVQYQRTEFNEAQYGPYPAKTTADRVTDENAPIEILVPDHPVFTTPNRIGPETWRGWVQERGTYFMGQRDPRYVDLLRSQDPFPYNAGAKTGILVEARVGKGRWIYTGLGLWRQLPAGT